MVTVNRRSNMSEKPETIIPVVTIPLESFFDVLNRDQRTIITISRNNIGERSGKNENCWRDVVGSSVDFPPKNSTKKSSPDMRDTHVNSFKISESDCLKGRNRSWESRRSTNPNGLMSRLGEFFIVGVCLLTIVRVPAVMSAPSARYHPHKTTEETPKYMYPCGKNHEEELDSEYYMSISRESDPEILKHIIIGTKNALSYAEGFRDRYVQETFGLPFDKHHTHWVNRTYDWLPNERNGIPKRLGENVGHLHLGSKTFDEFLVNIYEHLQKFAVALEQVVWDQKKTNGDFQEYFRMTEVHLRKVLCEIRVAMFERNVTPNEDVPRTIMKQDVREMEPDSFRNLRDWLIFRDLMNSLEYVIQVFTFLEENLSASSAASSS